MRKNPQPSEAQSARTQPHRRCRMQDTPRSSPPSGASRSPSPARGRRQRPFLSGEHLRLGSQHTVGRTRHPRHQQQRSQAEPQSLEATYRRPFRMHGSIGRLRGGEDRGRHLDRLDACSRGLSAARCAVGDAAPPGRKVRCIDMEGSGCHGHNGADDTAADAVLLAVAMPDRPVRVQGCGTRSTPRSHSARPWWQGLGLNRRARRRVELALRGMEQSAFNSA